MKRQRVFETIVVLLGALALLWAGTVTAAPPGNDDINSATAIGSLPFSDALDTTEATTAPDDPFCGGNAATVWYSFNPVQNMVVKFDTTGSDYGTSVSIYTGSPGALSQVTCTLTQATLNATGGTAYYIMIGASTGYPPPPGTGGGNLVLSVTELVAPANDNFASATSVGALPFSDTVDVGGASTEVNEPQVCYFSPHTVWYSFTPSQAVAVQVDPSGSTFGDTLVNVYQAFGPNITDLSFITCGTFGQSVMFSAQAGVTYYIQAGDIFGAGGSLSLNFTEIAPPSNDNFADATSITALPFDNTVNTAGATREADEPTAACEFGSLSGTVWYAFTPSTTGAVSASIFNTSFSTMVAAYTGSS